MNTKEFARQIETLCAAHKISVDIGIKFGNAYVDMISEKSDPETRAEAAIRVREFYETHGDVESVDGALCASFGLKKTNADKQWLSNQMRQLRLEYQGKPFSEAAE